MKSFILRSKPLSESFHHVKGSGKLWLGHFRGWKGGHDPQQCGSLGWEKNLTLNGAGGQDEGQDECLGRASSPKCHPHWLEGTANETRKKFPPFGVFCLLN